jgi:hypothetical protein
VEAADANVVIANQNGQSVEALARMYETAVAAGDRQQELAEFELTEMALDRQRATIEANVYKGVSLALLLALIL